MFRLHGCQAETDRVLRLRFSVSSAGRCLRRDYKPTPPRRTSNPATAKDSRIYLRVAGIVRDYEYVTGVMRLRLFHRQQSQQRPPPIRTGAIAKEESW